MRSNFLQLNQVKTEVLNIRSPHHSRKYALPPLIISDAQINASITFATWEYSLTKISLRHIRSHASSNFVTFTCTISSCQEVLDHQRLQNCSSVTGFVAFGLPLFLVNRPPRLSAVQTAAGPEQGSSPDNKGKAQ